jgi:hypothetical protein
MLIWPEASNAQNSIAAVSADGSTVCVLIRRLNSSCSIERGCILFHHLVGAGDERRWDFKAQQTSAALALQSAHARRHAPKLTIRPLRSFDTDGICFQQDYRVCVSRLAESNFRYTQAG